MIIPVCSQIWLNDFLDDRRFGYITKSLKKYPAAVLTHSLATITGLSFSQAFFLSTKLVI
jgi:hypothetical protein